MDTNPADIMEKKLQHVAKDETIKNNQTIVEYDKWADTFDQFTKASGYTAHDYGSTLLSQYLPDRKANILDFACGTGRAGEQLYEIGYRNIDGVDGSPKSVQVAEEKHIFTRLVCALVSGQTLDLVSDFYDGLICVGGFFPGGLKSNCFNEWIRTVKPGGYTINIFRQSWLVTCPDYNNGKLESAMNDLESAGQWKLILKKEFDGGHKEWNMIVFLHQII